MKASIVSNVLQAIGIKGPPFGVSHTAKPLDISQILDMVDSLLSEQGEASAIAVATLILKSFHALVEADQTLFFMALSEKYGVNQLTLKKAIAHYQSELSEPSAVNLHDAAEPQRQELIRRLNRAPGATASIVKMREKLLTCISNKSSLNVVDHDFQHLLSSWFNRGFLILKPINWDTPASILEKIINYEAVHKIQSWDDLRRRMEPSDRRCYAFFHPVMIDEPLIFVEVALEKCIPGNISTILSDHRIPIAADQATTAVFYSISNCQKGLRGISFGNFLIKQVVRDLARDLPKLKQFVTLSPAPGFRLFLNQLKSDQPELFTHEDTLLIDQLQTQTKSLNEQNTAVIKERLGAFLALYLLKQKKMDGFPENPVARFHLGNGARLEQINWPGDLSETGLQQSLGFMVNYLYDLNHIEKNHEQYIIHHKVIAAAKVNSLLAKLKTV